MNIATGKTALIKGYVKRGPFIVHVGIAYNGADGRVWVAHNSPLQQNNAGGSIIVEPIECWLKTRWVKNSIPLQITATALHQYVSEHYEKRFHLTRYNCEHFAYGFIHKPKSPQLIYWAVGLGLLAVVYGGTRLHRALRASKV